MDPNKYKGNEKIKPDTLLQTITSVGSMILMVIGIIGIATEFFKDDGWIGKILSFLFQSTATMLLIPLIIVVFWLLNKWISAAPNATETKRSGNLPMYIMVLIGAYYVFRFITG